MKVLKIERFKNIYDGTIGEFKLFDFADKNKVKGEILLSGYTLEPAGPDTVTPNKDLRIPQGKYDVVWEYSPRFGRVLPVLFNENVSKTRRILIHAGNYPKDTLGCVLLGGKYDGKGVYESKKTLEAFLNTVKNRPLRVEIINQAGV